MKINDEILSAYVDGELNKQDKEQLEKEILNNPSIQQRIDKIHKLNSLLNEAFVINENLPDKFIETIKNYSIQGASTTNVVRFQKSDEVKNQRLRNWLPTSIAASITLMLGVLLGSVLITDEIHSGFDSILISEIIPGNELHYVLENALSSTSVRLSQHDEDEVIFVPLLSFKSTNGHYCREFDVHDQTKTLAGIACREKDSTWRLEIIVASGSNPNSNEKYELAAGQDIEALNFIASKLMDSGPLTKEQERELISNNWQASAK